VIDLIMPGKEGLETIIEAKARFPDLKILAVTGGGRLGSADLLSVAREVGADQCLAKPIRNHDLVTAVLQLWGESSRNPGEPLSAAGS
jgi:CheY-like chemotaxis protein